MVQFINVCLEPYIIVTAAWLAEVKSRSLERLTADKELRISGHLTI